MALRFFRSVRAPRTTSMFILLTFLFSGCTKPGEFKASIMELGTSFTAKHFCSCLFVTEQSENFCRDYAAIDQVSPRLTVNYEEKTVKSSFFFLVNRTAAFKGPDRSCVLL